MILDVKRTSSPQDYVRIIRSALRLTILFMKYLIKRVQKSKRVGRKYPPKIFVLYHVVIVDSDTGYTCVFHYNTYLKSIRSLTCWASDNPEFGIGAHIERVKNTGFRRFPSDKLPQFISFENMPKQSFSKMRPNFIVKLKQDIDKSRTNYLKSLNNLKMSEKPLQSA